MVWRLHRKHRPTKVGREISFADFQTIWYNMRSGNGFAISGRKTAHARQRRGLRMLHHSQTGYAGLVPLPAARKPNKACCCGIIKESRAQGE